MSYTNGVFSTVYEQRCKWPLLRMAAACGTGSTRHGTPRLTRELTSAFHPCYWVMGWLLQASGNNAGFKAGWGTGWHKTREEVGIEPAAGMWLWNTLRVFSRGVEGGDDEAALDMHPLGASRGDGGSWGGCRPPDLLVVWNHLSALHCCCIWLFNTITAILVNFDTRTSLHSAQVLVSQWLCQSNSE